MLFICTSLFILYSAWWALTRHRSGIPYFSIFTTYTVRTIPFLTRTANAFERNYIKILTFRARRNRKTPITTPIMFCCTYALLVSLIPLPISSTWSIFLTDNPIPLKTCLAFTRNFLAIPLLSIYTLYAHSPIKIKTNRANTLCSSPNFAASTRRVTAITAIPMIIL